MSFWPEAMDLILTTSQDLFGQTVSYQRPGFSAFTLKGLPQFEDRLVDPNTGPFYSIYFRQADFINAPFTASVTATFTQVPNANGTLTFDGVTYTDVLTIDNSTPYQFARGSSAFGAASNLSACINAESALAGSFFSSSTTPHPTCQASWEEDPDGNGLTIVSFRSSGSIGNGLPAVDHMVGVSLSSKAFDGGLPLDNDLITLGGVLYRVSDVPEPDTEGGIHVRLEKKAL